jgi:hypothetical protein
VNDAGVHIPDVQGKAIVVTALIITGNTRNFQDVSSLQRQRELLIGLSNTSLMSGIRNLERNDSSTKRLSAFYI